MKNKKTIIIVCIVIIILACIIAIAINIDNIKKIFTSTDESVTEAKTEADNETVIRNYIEAFYTNSSSEGLIDTIDAKAGYAWESCEGDTSTFIESYEAVTDEQAEEWKNDTVSSMQAFRSVRDMISESYSMELVSVDSTEELDVENLEKITVTVKTTYLDEESNENEYTSIKGFYMYNGKIIAEEIIEE